MERRTYLQDRRRVCTEWLASVNLRTVVPNKLSVPCQQILDIIEGEIQSLDLWLRTLPERDRQDLESIEQPGQTRQVRDRFDVLSAPQQQRTLENLRREYHERRESIIDKSLLDEMKNDPFPY